MHRRAFRPDFSGGLEARSAPSSLAAPTGDPVVFSQRQLAQVTGRVQISFAVFSRFRQVPRLRDELVGDTLPIPFRRADGLDESIERIVDRMEEGLTDRVPGAVRAAQHEVVMTIRVNVANRVRSGDVVLR